MILGWLLICLKSKLRKQSKMFPLVTVPYIRTSGYRTLLYGTAFVMVVNDFGHILYLRHLADAVIQVTSVQSVNQC